MQLKVRHPAALALQSYQLYADPDPDPDPDPFPSLPTPSPGAPPRRPRDPVPTPGRHRAQGVRTAQGGAFPSCLPSYLARGEYARRRAVQILTLTLALAPPLP